MKRIFFSLILASAALSASAMNVRDARDYAYFLTDKMAYELNLTPLQYERVYEVNLDYFLAINSPYDVERYQDYRDDDFALHSFLNRLVLGLQQCQLFLSPSYLGTWLLGLQYL